MGEVVDLARRIERAKLPKAMTLKQLRDAVNELSRDFDDCDVVVFLDSGSGGVVAIEVTESCDGVPYVGVFADEDAIPNTEDWNEW